MTTDWEISVCASHPVVFVKYSKAIKSHHDAESALTDELLASCAGTDLSPIYT